MIKEYVLLVRELIVYKLLQIALFFAPSDMELLLLAAHINAFKTLEKIRYNTKKNT